MKNLLKRSLIFIMLLTMLPLATFLVACGATPSDDANTVAFVSDKYDEETGKAIFEVDLKTPTKLKFKCNPSTYENKASYTIPVEGQTNSSYNRSRFTFEKGVITVNYDDFEPIEIKISINGHTDQCIVRLKEYPSNIRTTYSDVIIGADSSYTIPILGTFVREGESVEEYVLEKDYKFVVSSDNEQVISIPNTTRLTVNSNGRAGTANVTIDLQDSSGNKKGTIVVKFTVVEMAKSAYLMFDGYDSFVEDGGIIELDANVLTANANGEYELCYTAFFISELGTEIENVGNIDCSSNDNEYVSFDEDNNLIKVKSNIDIKLKITMYTDLYVEVNNVISTLKMTFTIDFKAKD